MSFLILRQSYRGGRFSSLGLLCLSMTLGCQHLVPSLKSSNHNLPLHSQNLCHSPAPVDMLKLCDLELYLTILTNDFRYQHGLPPVSHNVALSYVAHKQSKRAADSGKISHDGFPYSRQLILSEYAPEERRAILAENLLLFRSRERDPQKLAIRIFQFWKDSADHRRQLLGPYQAHGASLVLNQNQIYAAAMFQ